MAAKTKISEIGWGIEAGENRAPLFGTLQEDIKAGSSVYITSEKHILKACTGHPAAGILNKHYATDLDTAIASGIGGNIVTRGYVNIFCDDAGADKEIGDPVFDTPTNAGIAPWSAGGRELGTLVDRIPDNDTVCRIWIDRG